MTSIARAKPPATPEAVAEDGSPVSLYQRLPDLGEAELVHRAIPAGARILELGCGAGRMTRGLVRRGHPVVGVDASAEMLRHVGAAPTVHARVEDLRLGAPFPVVLLATNLINVPDPELRRAFLATVREHLCADGLFVAERLDVRWQDAGWAADHRKVRLGAISCELDELQAEQGVISGTLRYRQGTRSWEHAFEGLILDDYAITNALADVGLAVAEWLDEDRTWFSARAADL